MAGSSMDGIDFCLVEFTFLDKNWTFQVLGSETIPYPKNIFNRLEKASNIALDEQKLLDLDFGSWVGDQVNLFLEGKKKPILLAIHGHTLIHDPQKGISWQLGKGSQIASKSNITTITNFRNKDISLGGQGAPLVPFGDFILFNQYDACINLGGIANISIKENHKAWDICPCNQVLNFYAKKLGKKFDDSGRLASQGTLDYNFINELKKLSFFTKNPPKSLANNYIPVGILDKINPVDGLRTYAECISDWIATDLNKIPQNGKVLLTGGGAYNQFLIERLKDKLYELELLIPDDSIIDFKEAIIFAFLGLMKKLGKINTYASVTGAIADSSGGEINTP